MHTSDHRPQPRSNSSSATPRGRRNRWLLIAALFSVVALYATQTTHLAKTSKDVRACTKCEVERPAVGIASAPELKVVPLRQAFAYVDLESFSSRPLPTPAALTPPSRAPPVLDSQA